MKKKSLIVLALLLVAALLLPTAALAETVSATPIYIIGFDGDNEPSGFSFESTEAAKDGEYPIIGAYLISEAGELNTDCRGAAVIINNVEVTLGEDGAVDTDNLYIFGKSGKLTVGEVTFTAGHSATIDNTEDINSIAAAVQENGNDMLNISGTIGTNGKEELVAVKNAAVIEETYLTLGEKARLTISGSFTAAEGTINPSQDAQIIVRAGASVSGLTLYDADTVTVWPTADPFTAEETFNWLGDAGDSGEWVRFVDDGGDPNAPRDFDFWVDYDSRDSARVERTENAPAYVFPARWSESFQQPEHFNKQGQTYDTLNFTLVPPDDDGTYDPIVEIEIYNGHEGDQGWVPNTVLSSTGGSPAIAITDNKFSYTPTSDKGFVVRVFWSQDEYDFAQVGGKYVIEFSWEGNGTVSVSGDNLTQETSGNRTKIGWDTDPDNVTFTVKPNSEGNDELKAVWIEQEANDDDNYNALTAAGSAFKEDGGSYTLDISAEAFKKGEENYFANVRFRFTGWNQQDPGPGNPQGPSENQYRLFYSDMGSVEEAASGAVQNFTEDDPITWALTYPNDVTNLYRVEINVNSEPSQHYEYNNGANNNSNEITVDNTGKTVSFTPNSANPFEVFIYWTEQDRFNHFGYNPDKELQLHCRVLDGFVRSTDDAPWCDYAQDGGWRDVKINVPKDTESFTITFANNEGYEFEKAEFSIPGSQSQPKTVSYNVSENTITWAAADFDKELNVYFKQSGQPGPNPPEPQGGIKWDALKSEIKSYIFAYGPETNYQGTEADMLKKGMIAELYARKMGGPGGSDTTLGMALGYNPEGKDKAQMVIDEAGLATKITLTLSDSSSTDGSIINGLPYYTYTLTVPDDEGTPDVTEGFTIENGKVYVLQKDTDFILKTTKTTDDVPKTAYKIVSYAGSKNDHAEGQEGNEEADRFVYAPFDVDGRGEPAIEAYGNGIFLNNAISEDGSVFGFHAVSEHCGSIGNINCRLIVSSAESTIQIKSTDDAAAWNFINVGVYNAIGTEEEPVNATIFYGADSITFSGATGKKVVTAVKAVDLPSGAISFVDTTKTLSFNTHYDNIKVKLTYSDDSVSYMVLNRVGLDINSTGVDKYTDVQNDNRFSNEEKDACTDDSFNVWHGTDNSVRYASDAEKVIVGTFYYDCNYYVEHAGDNKWHVYGTDGNFVSDDEILGNSNGYATKQAAVNALHMSIESVQLLVTITDKNNNVTRKLVSAPLSEGKAVNNGGFITDTEGAVGYAGQGGNHCYDDFVLWSGSEADFEDIESVSAIVYEAGGDEDSFGGVQVGSGAGVEWTNE